MRKIMGYMVAGLLGMGFGMSAFGALPTFTIPQEGLLYHLDAWHSDANLTKDSANRVSEWASKEGLADYKFTAVDEKGAATSEERRMKYDATAFGGLGGVTAIPTNAPIASTGAQWLLGSSKQQHRTVFLVFQWYAGSYFSHVFGHATRDCGIRGGATYYKFPVEDNGVYVLNGTTLTMDSPIKYNPDHLNETEVLMFETTEAYAKDEYYFNCIPGIGSYWINAGQPGNNERNMYGVYGEVIAYNRVLTDEEKQQVTQMLDLKWRSGANFWQGGATGDWNDTANWSKGTVPTVKETAYIDGATVTVSNGGTVLAGTIAGKDATVSVAAGTTFYYKGTDDTYGEVALAGAGAKKRLGSDLPVTENLVYHLDVTEMPLLQTNASGQVTEWISKTGDGSYVSDGTNLPIYDADGFGGLGGIKFGYNLAGSEAPTWLQADKSFPNRTVFLVYKWIRDHSYNQIFGHYHDDHGLRKNSSDVEFPNDSEATPLWIDGVSIPVKGFTVDSSVYGKTLVLSFQPQETNATNTTRFNNIMSIGSYWVNSYGGPSGGGRYSQSEFAEVAIYDRTLTEAERQSVEEQLKLKWQCDCYWTGAAGDKDWTNAANWRNGKVPSAKTDKITLIDADIEVNANMIVGTLWAKNATITVAGGATFAYMGIVSYGSGITFAGEGTAELFGTDLPVTSGLLYHLDAAKSASVVRDGEGRVTTWMDLSGNGNDFIAETAAKTYATGRPLYVADSEPMGRPALHFGRSLTGTNCYLRASGKLAHQTLFIMSRPASQRENLYCSRPYRYDGYGTIYSRFESFYHSIDFGTSAGCVSDGGLVWCFHPNGDFTSVRIDGEPRGAWAVNAGGESLTNLWSTSSYSGGQVDYHSALGDAFNLATFVYVAGKDRPNSDYYTWQPMVGGGYIGNGRYYDGAVSEIALYNRVLSDEEIAAVERTMLYRHFGVSWTGEGGDGKWSTAANWSTGAVPNRRNYVRIPAGASVTVDADASVGILEANDATISVAAGQAFYAGRIIESAGNTFATADGATFGYSVLKGKTETVPGVVTGTGTFAKGGTGTLTLTDGAIADTVKVTVDCGTLDLNGLSPTFAAMGGEGAVTNAPGTAVTLTIDNADAAAMSAKLADGIALVKQGAGELSVAPQALTAMTLRGGTVKTVTNLAYYASITGIVTHLDASRRDTLTVDANGLVSAWRSLVGDNVIYFDEEGQETNAYTATKPHYESSLVKGKYPSVVFGFNDDKTSSGINLLRSCRVLSQRTYFFVLMPQAAGNLTGYPNTTIASLAGPYGEPLGDRQRPICRWNKGSDTWADGGHYINGLLKMKNGDDDGSQYYGYSQQHTAADPHVACAITYDTFTFYKVTYDYPQTSGTLGGWHLAYTSGGKWISRGREFRGAICEMIVLDRAVTDEERANITAALLAKWGIAPEADQAFPKQNFDTLTFDAANGETMPQFVFSETVDLADLSLVFQNTGHVKGKTAIVTASPLNGTEPKSVEGLGTGHKLQKRGDSFWYRVLKGILYIFR